MAERRTRRTVRRSVLDPDSVDVFDLARQDDMGGDYCVAPAISWQNAEDRWQRYLQENAPACPEHGEGTR